MILLRNPSKMLTWDKNNAVTPPSMPLFVRLQRFLKSRII